LKLILVISTSKVGTNMDKLLRKRFVTGRLALLVGVTALGCLAFAGVSSAAVPPTGNNCVASDGKINGRGATFQKPLVLAFAKTYRDDYCGATGVATEKGEAEGEAGSTMIAYNYPGAEKASATGSGAGIKATSCRTDAFAGSDVPYTKKQLEEMDGTPGITGGCGIDTGTEKVFVPPFQPNSPTEWPSKEDTTEKVMSFPVGGSSDAIIVHLTNAECKGKAPPSLQFTANEVDNLFGGNYTEWTEKELTETNPSLAECAGAKITRIVRQDNSGTTNIFKFYLGKVDNARSGATCFELNKEAKNRTWEEYNVAPNTEWPGKGKEVGKEGTCSKIENPGKSGNPEVIKLTEVTNGAIGYADLAEAVSEEAKAAGLVAASVQNATKTSFQAPNAEKGANCDYKTLSLPGVTKGESVGLNPEESWANNNPAGVHGNATDLGAKYPICGITYDMVYSHLDNGAVPNPISRLSADQRRTLYAYYTFVLSTAAQETLNKIDYAALPSSWLGTLREGFQENF
jgi:ABC-type phosphate transport system substrate-binding protein